MQRRALPRGRTSPALAKARRILWSAGSRTEARGGVIFMRCAVSCDALGGWGAGWRWWHGSCERQMGTEGEVGGRAHLRSALSVGRPYNPSISPTPSTISQVMKSAVLPGPQLLSYPLQILSQWLL